MTILGNTIENNKVGRYDGPDRGISSLMREGGGISRISGTIRNNVIKGNQAREGGGIKGGGTITGNVISGNIGY